MSVPVFPYSNIVYFQFCSYSFNDSFVRHFIFLMKFWSLTIFHMKLLLLIKTFKGRFRSVLVFPYSNIGFFFFFFFFFKFSSCSFKRYFRPTFHIFDEILVLSRFSHEFQPLGRFLRAEGPIRYFHTLTSYAFNSVHIHLMTPLSVISYFL